MAAGYLYVLRLTRDPRVYRSITLYLCGSDVFYTYTHIILHYMMDDEN